MKRNAALQSRKSIKKTLFIFMFDQFQLGKSYWLGFYMRVVNCPRNPAASCHTRLWSGIISKFFWFWQLPSKHGIVFRAARPTLNLFSLISFGHTRQSRYAQSRVPASSAEHSSWHGQIIHVGKPEELTVLSGIDSNSKGNICGAVVTPFFPMLTPLNTFGAGPKAWIELQFSLSGLLQARRWSLVVTPTKNG